MIGQAIAAEAETWLGTPFHWQGRVKGAGVDCKGLVAGVAAACGRHEGSSLEALAGDYGAKVDSRRLKVGLARLFDKVSERQAGDVLLLIVGGKPQHLALAAPTEGKPSRTIQATCSGPCKVVAVRVPSAMVDSIWRWRDG
jgi:cell wall-associated NlpC family hydrolase